MDHTGMGTIVGNGEMSSVNVPYLVGCKSGELQRTFTNEFHISWQNQKTFCSFEGVFSLVLIKFNVFCFFNYFHYFHGNHGIY